MFLEINMFNVNGIPATLIQNNRNENDKYYDDQDKTQVSIVVCPYNADMSIKFGIYTIPEAKGYFIVKNNVDVKEGDQLIVGNRTFSIIDVHDNWIWNKVANIILAVK
jgi:hypothetical protein